MADTTSKTVREEGTLESRRTENRLQKNEKTPELSGSREKISGALSEGQQGGTVEELESGEIRETVGEGGEVKGEGRSTRGKAGKTGGKGGAFTFTFDEKNLPPVPEMIRKIEEFLRAEIRQLEKKARYYRGGIFRKPDYPQYSDTVIKMREKTVLLKKLLHMAMDSLKKLFLQMFGARG